MTKQESQTQQSILDELAQLQELQKKITEKKKLIQVEFEQLPEANQEELKKSLNHNQKLLDDAKRDYDNAIKVAKEKKLRFKEVQKMCKESISVLSPLAKRTTNGKRSTNRFSIIDNGKMILTERNEKSFKYPIHEFEKSQKGYQEECKKAFPEMNTVHSMAHCASKMLKEHNEK